tara:strand:- start:317 stop:904 length:588 start_codon:yes stop_codon:yes gene_type:complete
MNDGRKISTNIENPIDNILIDISYQLGKVFKILNITPNMITTMSLLFTLIGIDYMYNSSYKIAGILYFIGYFFDCMDGNYARTYNMTSQFGDYYDHIGDTIKCIFLLVCIYFIKIKRKTKIIIINIIFVLGLLMLQHLGCQEQIKDKKDKSVLEIFNTLCSNKEFIKYTKYLGCGTVQLIISLFIFNIKFIDRLF